MVQISLKGILAKTERLSLIQEIVRTIDRPLAIEDEGGELLLENLSKNPISKYSVEVSVTVIGWVGGGEKAQAVASLLAYLAKQELEKRASQRTWRC